MKLISVNCQGNISHFWFLSFEVEDFHLIFVFPNVVNKITNTANLIENEQKIKPLLWPSEVGNRQIRAFNLKLSGQILNMQSWFCQCVGDLWVTICLCIPEGRNGQTDMLCSLICIPVHQWNTTAPPLHTCAAENWSPYEELHHWDEILVQRLLSLALSLLRSFSYWYLYVRALLWLFCIRGTSNEQDFDKEYISILMLSDRCVQNWDFRGYIWLTR